MKLLPMRRLFKTGIIQGVSASALTLFFAFSNQWQPRDVVWGMWISSLIVGLLWLVALFVVSAVVGQREGSKDFSWSGAIMLSSIFLFLFLLVHLSEYALLAEAIPFSSASKLGPLGTVAALVKSFWAIILGSFIARFYALPMRGLASESGIMESEGRDPDFIMQGFLPAINLQVVTVGLLLVMFLQFLLDSFLGSYSIINQLAVCISLVAAYLPINWAALLQRRIDKKTEEELASSAA